MNYLATDLRSLRVASVVAPPGLRRRRLGERRSNVCLWRGGILLAACRHFLSPHPNPSPWPSLSEILKAMERGDFGRHFRLGGVGVSPLRRCCNSASGVGVRVKGSRTLGLAVPMFGVGVSTGRRGRGLLLIRRCSLTMLVFHLASTFLRGIPIGGFSGVGCDGGCRCPV